MENAAQIPSLLDEAVGAARAQVAQLETSRRSLEQHIRSLGGDRDRVVAELEAAQKEFAGVKAKQKEADALASRTVAEARAESNRILASARAEGKALLDAVRTRIAAATAALEAK